MSFRLSDPARLVVAMLLLGVFLGVGATCQIHPLAVDHDHPASSDAAPAGSHHATFGTSCLAAVLPGLMLFFALLGLWFAPSPVLHKQAPPVFLPFIPPRAVSR